MTTKATKTPKTTKTAKTPKVKAPKVAKEKAPKVVKPRKPRNYLNNRDLLAEVLKSKEQDKMTDKLAHMLTMLCNRYATKPNYVNYTYNDDMRGYAMMMICRTWFKFNPEKSDNPFAFYTQCIKHSFIQFLNQEKRQRDIRDEILVDKGLNPSFNYQMEHANDHISIDQTEAVDATEAAGND